MSDNQRTYYRTQAKASTPGTVQEALWYVCHELDRALGLFEQITDALAELSNEAAERNAESRAPAPTAPPVFRVGQLVRVAAVTSEQYNRVGKIIEAHSGPELWSNPLYAVEFWNPGEIRDEISLFHPAALERYPEAPPDAL